MADYKRIENMNRDELRDVIAEMNKIIQDNVHSGTRSFHRAMDADERKQKAQNRLSELEDFPSTQQQQKKSSIQNAFD